MWCGLVRYSVVLCAAEWCGVAWNGVVVGWGGEVIQGHWGPWAPGCNAGGPPSVGTFRPEEHTPGARRRARGGRAWQPRLARREGGGLGGGQQAGNRGRCRLLQGDRRLCGGCRRRGRCGAGAPVAGHRREQRVRGGTVGACWRRRGGQQAGRAGGLCRCQRCRKREQCGGQRRRHGRAAPVTMTPHHRTCAAMLVPCARGGGPGVTAGRRRGRGQQVSPCDGTTGRGDAVGPRWRPPEARVSKLAVLASAQARAPPRLSGGQPAGRAAGTRGSAGDTGTCGS